MTPQEQAQKLLLRYISSWSGENKREKRIDMRAVAKRATDDQALVFASIHDEAMKIVDSKAVRTRETMRGSILGVGLLYHDRPVERKRGGHKEVMACLFPTKGFGNRLFFYFRGVGEDPTGRAQPWKEGPQEKEVVRFGLPVLRADQPANHETTQWAINLLKVGFTHIQSHSG